jgi:hypothetical protein
VLPGEPSGKAEAERPPAMVSGQAAPRILARIRPAGDNALPDKTWIAELGRGVKR